MKRFVMSVVFCASAALMAMAPARSEACRRLITALYALRSADDAQGPLLTLEQLGDEAGVGMRDLPHYLHLLTTAGICLTETPLEMQLAKGVRGDAQARLQRLITLEVALLQALIDRDAASNAITLSLKTLAADLAPIEGLPIRAPLLATILELWHHQGRITLWLPEPHIARVQLLAGTPDHQDLAVAILAFCYAHLGTQTGARLRVTATLESLLEQVAGTMSRSAPTPAALQYTLLWLMRLDVLRLTEGMRLIAPAWQVTVRSGVRIDRIDAAFRQEIEPQQAESAWRVHALLVFANLTDATERQKLLDAYLHLTRPDFLARYPTLADPVCRRPVFPELYDRILAPLNDAQRAIVLADDPALAIIAGPGSGKTKTILHRVAYLLCVRRIPASHILVLAYNRQAVRDLRVRLGQLLGRLVLGVRIMTFHGLALSLVGRSVQQTGWHVEDQFAHLIDEATQLLEGHDLDFATDAVTQRNSLLDIEHIFVDEYQDVSDPLYRFIRAIAGATQASDDTRPVQISLCVIGDDDQTVYGFTGASPEYLLRFAEEYQARSVVLTENYRSTEPIIAATNALIRHNLDRCKVTSEQQVCIDAARRGSGGKPVQVVVVEHPALRAQYIATQVREWLADGVAPCEIAVLARWWEPLDRVRLLLERSTVATLSLGQRRKGKQRDPHLLQHHVTWCLMNALAAAPDHQWEPGAAVAEWFINHCSTWGHTLQEATTLRLARLLHDLDQERTLGDVTLARTLTNPEVIAFLYETNGISDRPRESESVLVSSAHSAKGSEFRRVIILSEGFDALATDDEDERRLLYVAMTRAREELLIVAPDTLSLDFMEEAELPITRVITTTPQTRIPQWYYGDLTLADVILSHRATLAQQTLIQTLREDDLLDLSTDGGRYAVSTPDGTVIGGLSQAAMEALSRRRIAPGAFAFAPGEVRVRHVVQWTDHNEHQAKLWIVLPQIRVLREAAYSVTDEVNILLGND